VNALDPEGNCGQDAHEAASCRDAGPLGESMLKLSAHISALALIAALAACSPSQDTSDDAAMTDDGAMSDDMAASGEGDVIDDEGMSGDAAPMSLSERLANAERPDGDVELDPMRHPAEILTFAGVRPGWRVADLGAGGGYYTRVLSAAVGGDGHVYSQNFDWTVERFPNLTGAMDAMEAGYSNVSTHVTSDTAPLDGIEGDLDGVFIVLLYHDQVLDPNEDMAAMNQAIYDGLRPGGVYVIVDHAARPGSGEDDIETLHRIDEAVVRAQVEAAGFEFQGASDILANADDDHTLNVFDPSIRRQTDRFVLVYRKPM
jgi:predicted methyltransferase